MIKLLWRKLRNLDEIERLKGQIEMLRQQSPQHRIFSAKGHAPSNSNYIDVAKDVFDDDPEMYMLIKKALNLLHEYNLFFWEVDRYLGLSRKDWQRQTAGLLHKYGDVVLAPAERKELIKKLIERLPEIHEAKKRYLASLPKNHNKNFYPKPSELTKENPHVI